MDSRSRFDVVGLLAPLRRYAAVLTRNEADADDLVHDTLVRAYERQGTFRAGGNLRTWLLSILHNTFIDEHRRQKAEAQRRQGIADLTCSVAPADQENGIRLRQIQEAFFHLPDEQRSALHLVAIEGLSYQDAAAALGIPLGTLMSRLSRARAALRAFEDGSGQVSRPDGKPRPQLRIVGGSHD